MKDPIVLGEVETITIPEGRLTADQLRRVKEELKDKVEISRDWSGYKLAGNGWVGQLPIDSDERIVIRPKAPTTQIFKMLEIAYDLEKLDFPDGHATSESVEELFESLACILAQKTLRRLRTGIHREYVGHQERLAVARGRILPRETAAHLLRGGISLECSHEEQSADIGHNRVVAWVLYRLSRGIFQSAATHELVRRAYRGLSAICETVPHSRGDCDRLDYHRMNADYRPMHALCRFFLEHMGATGNQGDREFLPFAIYMPSLFERFVFRWLERHLGDDYIVIAQHNDHVGTVRTFTFRIDVLIREASTGLNVAVLDTKYKLHEHPSNDDIYQIAFYANRMAAPNAILVYPIELYSQHSISADAFDRVSVQTMTFQISDDLAAAGERHISILRSKLRAGAIA